ncbi:hypothetical protein K1718_20945 [Roseibium porphyridii]|uniref:GNAT family N-acetyltransferase n=1 Tax=Roseibium porphyridii TaxID=2866279 RepID=A0ABY8F1G3_9HYPH|nr:hypothetical protein [Roseibium sp. KMA01]WFE88609.1 hypothetical protein K1718_20945 [Roseibium sp. KMA01]
MSSGDHSSASEVVSQVPEEVLPPDDLGQVGEVQSGQAPVSPRPKSNMTVRLANGSESDCRAGVFLAREAHRNTIFREIPFSEDKARAIFEKATSRPDRFGLIYAVPSADEPLSEDGLYGFASVHAGEYFLGTGALIATVQTLNISKRLAGTLLGGKVALRLVQAVRHWAKERGCAHFMVHVTNGDNAEEADRFFRRCGMKTIGGNYV